MAKISLQDYIDEYLADRNSRNTKTYEQYIMRSGKGGHIVAHDTKTAAEKKYARSQPTYGRSADGLAESGLAGSGYASYLQDAAAVQRKNDYDMARGALLSIEADNMNTYKDYIGELQKESLKKRDDILKKLEGAMITDYDRLYGLVLQLGLSESDASALAKLKTETAIKKLTDKAVIAVIDHRMTKGQAQLYAEGLGLPKPEVEKIADYAEKINQLMDYNDLPQEYLDYLKEKLGK